MSQLPGTIRIKRKLVEEPPETLYIEREGQELAVPNTHAMPVYRLVSQTKRARTGQSTYEITPESVIGKNDLSPVEINVGASQPEPLPADHLITQSQATPSSPGKPKIGRLPQPRRVFHLSTTKIPGLSRSSSSSSLRGISRRRGRHGSSIAVFAEKRALRVEEKVQMIMNSRPGTPGTMDDEGSLENTQQKRPLTRSIHRSSVKDNTRPISAVENDTNTSLNLAAQLRQFAMETESPSDEATQPILQSVTAIRKKPLKFQPKPPPPRSIVEQPVAYPSPITALQDENKARDSVTEEWVYDVYVRDTLPPTSRIATQSSMLHSMNGTADASVGVIVIRPEDEEEWEEFMSDEEDSEKDWAGDDDDSNAEDYYANDYPDELRSDDEWVEGRSSDAESTENRYDLSDREDD